MGLFKKERLPKGAEEPSAAAQHTLLVVDDEDGNLRVLRSILSSRFRVLEAHDGQEALELLQSMSPEQAPSIILSDQRMPRMTGVELFERVRELLPASMRIIITGFVDVGVIVDAINRAGIYKFLVKPFDRNELLLTVERALEAYEMRRELDQYVLQLETKVSERTAQLEQKNTALEAAYAELERASLIDPLTGLGNRRYLARRVGSDKAGSDKNDSDTNDPDTGGERRQRSVGRHAFMLLDVDHFKSVNDEYGHAAGDAVLAAMGALLREHCRDSDLAVRWGGEEFLMRLYVDDPRNAMLLAGRLRAAVAATEFDIGDGRRIKRTCSIGVALFPFDPDAPRRLSWERVIAVADAALYLAKSSGRNRALGLMCKQPLPTDFESRLAAEADALVQSGVLRLEHEPDSQSHVQSAFESQSESPPEP